MNLQTITPAPYGALSLSDVWAHLRLVPDGSPAAHPDDDMLERLIITATLHIERLTRRSIVQQTLRAAVASFPVAGDPSKSIRLYRGPVVRVTSVQYYDADGVLQSVSLANTYITDEQVPELRFVDGWVTPTIQSRPDAVRVEYVAGYVPDGSPPVSQADYTANIPRDLLDAALIAVQLLYDDVAPADAEKLLRMQAALVQPHRIQIAI